MHELLVVAGLQLLVQVFVSAYGAMRAGVAGLGRCCRGIFLFFREGFFFFYAIAGFVRPLGWHILRAVHAANESKASTLFADMEAALQGRSFQPAKRRCGHEITLKQSGRYRGSYLATLCKPVHTC